MGRRRKAAAVDEDGSLAVEADFAPGRAAYAPAFGAGFQATASSVQEMHEAISGKTFDHLLRVPGLSMPMRMVQGMHDAITQGVYAAVRHGGGLAFSPASRGNGLAISMGLHARRKPLAITGRSLATLAPRVCVFVHGLGCDEQSWALRSDAWSATPWTETLPNGAVIQYGALLEVELGMSAVYLRYNSGLSIDDNARQLEQVLERVATLAPQVEEWVLVGHSMGGLVGRRAHALAVADGLAWASHTSTIVCLGSPNQGAPLEKIVHATTRASKPSSATRPLARLADARRRGIRDLRRGLHGVPKAPADHAPALRLVFATLGDETESAIGRFIGQMFGDGLVMAASAAESDAIGDVQRAEIAGLGHMGLLNDPRVYAVLRGWLGAPAPTSPARRASRIG